MRKNEQRNYLQFSDFVRLKLNHNFWAICTKLGYWMHSPNFKILKFVLKIGSFFYKICHKSHVNIGKTKVRKMKK